MKKGLRASIYLLAAIILLSSCGKKYSEQLKVIPKNSVSIAGFNLAAMGDTLAKDNASIDTIFNQLKETTGTEIISLNELKNSGIDFGKTIYVFGTQTNSVSKGTVRVINAAAAIKNEKQLDSFLLKQKDIGEVKKGSNFSYRLLGNNMSFAWNKETVVVTSYTMVQEKVFDSTINALRNEQTAKQAENMLLEVEKLFNLKESESAASLDGFVELVKSTPHAFVWNNMDNVVAAYMTGTPFAMGLSEIFRDNFVATAFNFERGQIASHSTIYFNDGMKALLKQYGGAKTSTELLSKYPSQNINAAFVASINPQMVPALLKLSSTESIANLGLTTMGLTTNDLTSWMKGDIAVVISDFGIGLPANTKGFSLMDLAAIKPSGKILVNIPVANKAALNKLLTAGTKYIEEWKQSLQKQNMYLKITDDNVFVTTDTTLMTQYLTSKQPLNSFEKPIATLLNDKMAAGYFDINKTTNGINLGSSISIVDSIKTKMNNTFGYATFSMENFDGKVIKADAAMQLKDQSMNSASVLVKMIANTMNQFKDFSLNMEKEMNEKYKNMKPEDILKQLKEE